MTTVLLSCVLTTPVLAQDTYWALKGNKVLNTRTGKVCDQRVDEYPIYMGYNAGMARGVIDAGGHSMFTFSEREIYDGANAQTITTNGGGNVSGGTAAFLLHPDNGRCKQYCVVHEMLNGNGSQTRGLALIKLNAPYTNAINEPKIDQQQDVDHEWPYIDGDPPEWTTTCVTPDPIQGGHYIYFSIGDYIRNPNGSRTDLTKLLRFTVDRNGKYVPPYYALPNLMPLIDAPRNVGIKASQNGETLAYQDENKRLVIVDANTGSQLNIFPIGATIYGLEQFTLSTGEKRWYFCSNDAIRYVVQAFGATSITTVKSIPSGLKTNLALGRNGMMYYATAGGYMNYFDPATASTSVFTTTQVANSAGSVFMGAGGYYSFGNLVTGEDNSTADAYDELHDYTISTSGTMNSANNPYVDFNGGTSITWKPRKNVIIQKGADLTINGMNIEMGKDAKVIVEPSEENVAWAAYLKLDNTTIGAHRTGCGNESNLWEGINVCGRGSDYPQVYLYGDNHLGRHATLEMVNKSVLQDANWAVKNIGPNDDGTNSYGGGIIIAENSSFINNCRSVAYAPFAYHDPGNGQSYHPYRSSFTECTFEVNRNIPNGFVGFVTGWNVDGVLFKGCSFTDRSNTTNLDALSYGILGSGMGFIVTQSDRGIRSSFTRLSRGIEAWQGDGTHPIVDVRYTDFSNNDVGIYTNAIDFPVMANNAFQIPDFTINKDPNVTTAIGIRVETGVGYTIRDNTFAGIRVQGSSKTTGVVISGTGGTDHVVHSNSYNDLYVANLSNYNNRGQRSGLAFMCNNYNKNQFDESARGKDPNVDGMSPGQGSDPRPAGNKFNGSAVNLDNDPLEVGQISYFYSPSLANEYPYAISSNSTSNVALRVARENSNCDYAPLGPAYTEPRDYGYGAKAAGNEGLSIPEQIATTYDPDKKMALLQAWHNPYSDLIQADILLSQGYAAAARKVFADIHAKYELTAAEAKAFGTAGQQLLELGIAQQAAHTGARGLDAQQVAQLEDIAANSTLWAKARAENWLHQYDGRTFHHEVLLPFLKGAPEAGKEKTAMIMTHASVFPNPVHDFLNVSYPTASDKNAVIRISDITGKLLISAALSGDRQQVDMRALTSGIYFYQILENNVVKEQGKVTRD